MLDKLKEEVLKANLLLKEYNLITLTWGNVSGIDREKGIIAIKPSGVPYSELTTEKIVLCDMHGKVLEGTLNPSSDLDTHIELYKAFKNIGGVVHTHSTFATAFSQAKTPIFAYGTTHSDTFYGAVPCSRVLTDDEINTDYEKNTGLVIAETISNPDEIPAVLVANHGPFAWGNSPIKAVENILILEETAKMAYLTKTINYEAQEVNKTLLDKHYLRKHGPNAYYGQNHNRFSKLLCSIDNCECSKSHSVPIKEIIMKKDAIKELKRVINGLGNFENIYMICDTNTYEVAGKLVEKNINLKATVKLEAKGLHANEHGIGLAENAIDNKECDLLIAVGSGTVHDITRYIAFNKNLNFVSVPTAPSVDGFVSNVAALTLKGVKATVPAVCPIAMVADTNVLTNSPQRLIASGFCDLLGKYTALADWKIGKLLINEHYCERIANLEYEALKAIVNDVEKIKSRDPEAIENLMYGLVLSGMAIQMMGYSRPASGSEHHISHFIEMNVLNNENEAYHGEKVGIGLNIISKRYYDFINNPDSLSLITDNTHLPLDDIKEVFKGLTEEILKENSTNLLETLSVEKIAENFKEIKKIVEEIPNPEKISHLIKTVGAPSTLEDINISHSLEKDICKYSPFVRNRLTLMRIISVMS